MLFSLDFHFPASGSDLPMVYIQYCNCTMFLEGITVSVLHYVFCWHQTDLQSSFIIHGHRLSTSQPTKWPRGTDRMSERERDGRRCVLRGWIGTYLGEHLHRGEERDLSREGTVYNGHDYFTDPTSNYSATGSVLVFGARLRDFWQRAVTCADVYG